jgi:prepilin-type N-terminal cleavage/methylation domain-containing protein
MFSGHDHESRPSPVALSLRLNQLSSSPTIRRQGFTLLELVIVLFVIAIVAALLIESYKSFETRAQRTQCASNLRNLFIALDADTRDQGHWPQCPFEIGHPQFDIWWIKELSRYNISQRSWECPTYKRLVARGEAEKKDDKQIDYVPTPFDDQPRTPYKWAQQPWAVEVGDFHGDGNLILFPDGSIKGFNQFLSGNP